MKLLLIILLVIIIALTSCATAPPQPVEVKVPVPVACVTALPAKPVYATDALPANASDFDKIKAVTLDWLAYRSYVPKLEAGLEACK